MKSIVAWGRRRSYLSSYSNWTKRATSERWRVAYVPLAATTAKSANGVLISLSQSGRGMQSASVKQMMSAVAVRAPTLRAVSQLEPRLREAAKLGFKRCVVPRSRQLKDSNRFEGLEIIQCRTLHEAVETALIK